MPSLKYKVHFFIFVSFFSPSLSLFLSRWTCMQPICVKKRAKAKSERKNIRINNINRYLQFNHSFKCSLRRALFIWHIFALLLRVFRLHLALFHAQFFMFTHWKATLVQNTAYAFTLPNAAYNKHKNKNKRLSAPFRTVASCHILLFASHARDLLCGAVRCTMQWLCVCI